MVWSKFFGTSRSIHARIYSLGSSHCPWTPSSSSAAGDSSRNGWTSSCRRTKCGRAKDHFAVGTDSAITSPTYSCDFSTPAVQAELGIPYEALAVPLHTMGGWTIRNVRTLIVENRVNLMTLPKCTHCIAIGGLGNGASLLRYVSWLQHARVCYWGRSGRGHCDPVSEVRSIYPATESLFMDCATLDLFRHLAGQGSGRRPPGPPANLTPSEAEAFRICDEEGLRLEQERIPQAAVVEAFAHRLGAGMTLRCPVLSSLPSVRSDAGSCRESETDIPRHQQSLAFACRSRKGAWCALVPHSDGFRGDPCGAFVGPHP